MFAPVLRPVERENADKTCTDLPADTFANQLEALLRTADLGTDGLSNGSSEPDAATADKEEAGSVSAKSSLKTSIPPLHAANMALYNAKEELRQACDVLALLTGVPSGVPPDGKLFQVRFLTCLVCYICNMFQW